MMASDSYLIHHVSVCQRGPRQCAKKATEHHLMQEMSPVSCERVLDPPLPNSCFCTSASKPPVCACSGSLSAWVSVSRRNCCADWKEARRYAAVAYVTQNIYCLCMLCCLCIHIISAYMDACLCALRPGVDELLCFALHGSLARSLG